MPTVAEAIQVALQHHQGGRLGQAEAIYRQILQHDPNCAPAMHLLGVLALQTGHPAPAAELIAKSIAIEPNDAAAHSNLGNALFAGGKFDQAETAYRRALELQPGFAEVHYNLANVLRERGDATGAIESYRQAIRCQPAHGQAHYNLAKMMELQGDRDEALRLFREAVRLMPGFAEAHASLGSCLHAGGAVAEGIASLETALRLRPNLASAHNNLGTALQQTGRTAAAIAAYRKAVELKPDSPESLCNLASALLEEGATAEAAAVYQKAIVLRPEYPEAFAGLGLVRRTQGDLTAAEEAYRAALRLKPDYADVWTGLGNTLRNRGRLDDAIAAYHRVVDLEPANAMAHSNLVYTLHFSERYDPDAIFAALREWDARHAAPLSVHVRTHANDRSPDRRLRVGYVSPDYRFHSMASTLIPLFEAHDHERFEVVLYCDSAKHDDYTRRIMKSADKWVESALFSDARLADAVRADEIDVLVDLVVHLGANRLLSFARRPAPVQVTYLGHPGSTGMTAIDYRLTDGYLDPPGAERYSSEKLVRLPDSLWCYEPMGESPDVDPLPARRVGRVTFGCLNSFFKVRPPAIQSWARILAAVPGSELLVLVNSSGEDTRVEREMFEANGVDPSRLQLVGRRPRAEYLALYNRVDIVLDPFPYNGHSTNCDAMWMGVPFVSLAGPMAVGRGGLSLLSNVGLQDLVAYDVDGYVATAVRLASDLPALATLRDGLRERMKRSPLMDYRGFARNVEAAYREMWCAWCAAGPRA